LNRVSFDELSVQEMSIRVEEIAVAERPVGAAGSVAGVMVPAMFEYADGPAPLDARTR
jgi:hypothetical protein